MPDKRALETKLTETFPNCPMLLIEDNPDEDYCILIPWENHKLKAKVHRAFMQDCKNKGLLVDGTGYKNWKEYIEQSCLLSRLYNAPWKIELQLDSNKRTWATLVGLNEGAELDTADLPDFITSISSLINLNNLAPSVRRVVIPPLVTDVPPMFSNCKKLEAVVLSDYVQRVISSNTFRNCVSLKEYTMPVSCASIPVNFFLGCKGLTKVNISPNCRSIQNNAFQGCSSLTEVTVPYMTTGLGYSAFEDCSKLKAVHFETPEIEGYEKIGSVGSAVFKSCTELETVTGFRVATLSESVFEGCTSLKQVTGLDRVTRISNHAFKGCSSLDSLVIGTDMGSFSVGFEAFHQCGIREITLYMPISRHILDLSYKSFIECPNLESVTLLSSYVKIVDISFCDCPKLKEIRVRRGTKVNVCDKFKELITYVEDT